MLKLKLGLLVDTVFYIKQLARLKFFIHIDTLVPVCEFAVMVMLSDSGCFISKWQLHGADHCGHNPVFLTNYRTL